MTAATGPYEVTLHVPATAHEIAALQVQAAAELEAWRGFTIDTAEEYTAVDAVLSEVVRKLDATTAMRGRATGPLYKATKEIEGWFAPVIATLKQMEKLLKGGMSDYRLAQADREREARELAAAAAETGDGGALVEALTIATEAAQAPAGRASASFSWVVERVNADMLPDEWWCPDMARIEAEAKACKGDEPPVIPGVVFKRTAKIGAKR